MPIGIISISIIVITIISSRGSSSSSRSSSSGMIITVSIILAISSIRMCDAQQMASVTVMAVCRCCAQGAATAVIAAHTKPRQQLHLCLQAWLAGAAVSPR
uniref:Uncharacterized protein n=1 Tax=Tetradesmus obliquus TaxID=3088 RepID=A0A383VHY2_TETOB